MEPLKCLVHMHLTLHWMRCTVTTRPSTYKAGSNGVGTGHPSPATNQGVVSTAPGSRRGGLRGLDHYLPLGGGRYCPRWSRPGQYCSVGTDWHWSWRPITMWRNLIDHIFCLNSNITVLIQKLAVLPLELQKI
jgi:hypothetical protein